MEPVVDGGNVGAGVKGCAVGFCRFSANVEMGIAQFVGWLVV